MSWFTFGGEYHELYNAIIIAWCIKMNIPTDEQTLSKYFKLHLERGISHLSGTNFIKNLKIYTIDIPAITFLYLYRIRLKDIPETTL